MSDSSSPPLMPEGAPNGAPSRQIVVPDGASVEAKTLALQLERELAVVTKQTGQLRIDDPAKFAVLTGGAGVWNWLDWLGRTADEAPTWGSKARDVFLDDLWREEPLLSGVMFSMVSSLLL